MQWTSWKWGRSPKIRLLWLHDLKERESLRSKNWYFPTVIVTVSARVRLLREFLRLLFCDCEERIICKKLSHFGMLFIPKTIIIFNFYLFVFGVFYVVKLRLALEIVACPIRASIFCRCSKMLARFQLLLAPGNRASAYVAPWNKVYRK